MNAPQVCQCMLIYPNAVIALCGTLPACFYTTGLPVRGLSEELCTRLGEFLKMPLSCALVQVSFILEFPILQKVISEYQKCWKCCCFVALTFKSDRS